MIPNIELNDKKSIPQLGFGTFLVEPDQAERVVSEALEVGYRHIDTAAFYGNEEGVGRAINNSGIPREEIFLTTKLWNDRHEDADVALNESLERLGMEYVDLYLIHWPLPRNNKYITAWNTMAEQREKGLTRSIGVCNFMPEHLDNLVTSTDVVPVVNQIELHPWMQQKDTRATAKKHGIAIESWHPLGQMKKDLTEFPAITDAAEAHGKSAAQVMIRWHLQNGLIVFPKTNHKERMQENFEVFDFELSDDQMSAIEAMDQGDEGRIGFHPNERE
ncbi:aldo/keto reductase [Corynebacterium breve]|uniref:Aldo/keto reductase n=1 Tax=Corynebacterium breve TaxID=3049799 RepID=A0ABY8VCM2_9CORY|nr:aldo/keto reductase [Corynebacterium breve]WIM67199.1 aldo/keto reductase [Corynebacterium breve]